MQFALPVHESKYDMCAVSSTSWEQRTICISSSLNSSLGRGSGRMLLSMARVNTAANAIRIMIMCFKYRETRKSLAVLYQWTITPSARFYRLSHYNVHMHAAAKM